MAEYLVFGYARVSTENQIENYSIDEQVERIKAFCIAKGWTLLHVYIDGGFSGGNTDRPALQEMLSSVRRNEADAIVVYKLDRLSRSQKDTLTLIEDELLSHKTDFVSINENFDTSTPFGRAMIGILSVFAQLEKDQITERFTMGRIGRSKAGYYHGSSIVPTGYVYENGELQIDPLGEVKIHNIFDSFLAGDTINSIMNTMRERYGGNWSAAKVAGILRNDVYIGRVKFGGVSYEGRHKPIISTEQFNAVKLMLEKRESPLRTPFKAEYMLTGLLRCSRCGARYSADHGFYKCYSRAKSCKRFIKDPNCKNDNWRIEDLDEYVTTYVKAFCADDKKIEALKDDPHPDNNVKALKKRITDLDKQIGKLIELYQFSAIPMETLTQRVQDIRGEKHAILAQIDAQSTKLTDISDRAVYFNEHFDNATIDGKRLLISSIVEEITIDGQSVRIHLRV